MRSIARYLKATDDYTTFRLIEPEQGEEGAEAIIELCEVDTPAGVQVYVSLPDGVDLPAQPASVASSLEDVDLTEEVRDMILEHSPHVRLIRQRVAAGVVLSPAGHVVPAADQAAAEAWGAAAVEALGL